MKLILIFVFLFCVSGLSKAQPEYWQRIYDPSIFDDFFVSVLEQPDKSIYTFGVYFDMVEGQRSFIYKLDRFGNIIFEKKYPQLSLLFAASVCVNDKFYSVGYNDSLSICILNTNGDIISYKNYHFGYFDLTKIYKDSQNKLIAIGTYQNQDGLIAKFDLEGNLEWYKLIPSNYHAHAIDVTQINSTYLFLNSNKASPGDTTRFSLMTIDLNGNIIKDSVFLKQNFIAFSNVIEVNSVYHIFGRTGYHEHTTNIIYKIDTNYTLEDIIYIDNSFIGDDYLIKAAKYKNGFLISSYLYYNNDSTFCQIKYIDIYGNIIQKKNLNGMNYNYLADFFISENSNILLCGVSAYRKFTDDEAYLVKCDSNFYYQNLVGINSSSEIIPENFQLHQNYPNPFNPATKISYSLKKSSDIELKLFDINGRLIKILESGFKQYGNYEINFSAEGLSSGVYFYSLYSDGVLADTKKAVVMK